MRPKAIGLSLAIAAILGCRHSSNLLAKYRLQDPSDPEAILRLPCLVFTNGAENDDFVANWFQSASTANLVGQHIDDVINVFGTNYLISLYRGREEPRMYYHLTGTYSWGFWGVVVLDADLIVQRFTLDPES